MVVKEVKAKDILELYSKKTDKNVTVYSIRECPRYTEVTLMGDDEKGRKFCRIVPWERIKK